MGSEVYLTSTMKVPLAVLADAANVSREGKLNIFGIFNRLWAVNFPAQHPQMQLVMVFEADSGEAEQKKIVNVQLMDADGKKILAIEGEFTLPKAQAGHPIRINHILPLPGIPLPGSGDYEFTVLVNGETKAHVPFSVAQARPEGAK